MRIVQLLLYLLIWCQAGEALTGQVTGLGRKETINCDLNVEEVVWLLVKLPDPPVVILKVFSNPPIPFYVNNTFKHKYSVQSKNLIINNISPDDLGVYYCTDLEISQFSDGKRLQIIAPTHMPASTEFQNHTEVKYVQQNQTPWKIFFIISGLLNALLSLVVIGLVKVFVFGKQSHTTDRQQRQGHPQESNEPEYAEVNLSKLRKPVRQSQVGSSTYSTIKLPKS